MAKSNPFDLFSPKPTAYMPPHLQLLQPQANENSFGSTWGGPMLGLGMGLFAHGSVTGTPLAAEAISNAFSVFGQALRNFGANFATPQPTQLPSPTTFGRIAAPAIIDPEFINPVAAEAINPVAAETVFGELAVAERVGTLAQFGGPLGSMVLGGILSYQAIDHLFTSQPHRGLFF